MTNSDIAIAEEDPMIAKINALTLEHLDDENFSVEFLATLLFKSKMQLHRKVKALTGKSPGQMIRTIKMEKAKELLKTGQTNITLVAFAIGFSDSNYFSTAYKGYFGVSPSQDLKK